MGIIAGDFLADDHGADGFQKGHGELNEGSRMRWDSIDRSDENFFQQCAAECGFSGTHGTDGNIEPPL
jgi:hypothetical protein